MISTTSGVKTNTTSDKKSRPERDLDHSYLYIASAFLFPPGSSRREFLSLHFLCQVARKANTFKTLQLAKVEHVSEQDKVKYALCLE